MGDVLSATAYRKIWHVFFFILTHLRLCLATAIHNLKWVKIKVEKKNNRSIYWSQNIVNVYYLTNKQLLSFDFSRQHCELEL